MRAGNDFHDTIWPGEAADAGGRLQPGSGAGGSGADAAGRREEPAAEEAAAAAKSLAPDVNDADIMKDIDVSKLDWSQLNVDASTLTGPAPKGRAASKGASADATWSTNAKPNGASAVSVKQSLSPFWDTRIGADMTVARQGTLTTSEELYRETLEWRQPAAILRHRLGGDHRPRRGLDLGQDRGRSPRRSRTGPDQARHLLEQVAAAERRIIR